MIQNKKKPCEQLFYFGYFLFAAYSYLVHIDIFSLLMKIGLAVAALLLVFCFIISQPFTIKEIVSLIIFASLVAVITATSKDFGFFKLLILMIGMKHVNFKKLVVFDYKIRIFFIIWVFFLCLIGVAPDQIVLRDNMERHSLGFTNPNVLGITVSVYVFEYLYLHKLKLTIWRVFWIFTVVGFISYITDSRSAVFINLVLILLAWIYSSSSWLLKKGIIKKIFIYSFLLFAGVTLLSYDLYKLGGDFAITLNKLLSNRLERIYIFAQEFDFSWFGQNISLLDMSLDNMYAYIFFGFGFIAFLICLILSILLIKKLYFLNDIPLVIIWVCFFAYGLSERIFILAEYNVFMLAFSYLLYSNKEENVVEEKYIGARL